MNNNSLEIFEKISFSSNLLFVIATAFISVQIRAFLEMFVYYSDEFRASFYLFHLPLFFFSIFLTIAVFFSYLTDVSIKKSISFFLSFMPIIILVPIIDAFVYGLQLRGIYYINIEYENSFSQFIHSVFFRGHSESVSIGQYLVMHISAWGTAFFFWRQKRAMLPSLLMWFLVYAIAFFYVTLESGFHSFLLWIRTIISSFSSIPLTEIPASLKLIIDREMFVCAVYLLLCIPLGFVILMKSSRFTIIIKNCRPLRAMHYLMMYVLGLLLHNKSNSFWEIPLESNSNFLGIMLGGIAVVSAFLSAVWWNDLFDKKIDRISNPNRPFCTGKITSHEIISIAVVLLLYSLLCTLPLGVHITSLLLCCNGIAFVYSAPPLRLRQYFPMGSIVIGICSAIAMLVGFFLLNGNHYTKPSVEYFLIPLGVAFLSFFKDIKDLEGDSADGSHSLMNILPPLYGRCATAICIFIGINIIFACFAGFVVHPAGIVLGLIGAFLTCILRKPDKIPLVMYLTLMIIILFYFMR